MESPCSLGLGRPGLQLLFTTGPVEQFLRRVTIVKAEDRTLQTRRAGSADTHACLIPTKADRPLARLQRWRGQDSHTHFQPAVMSFVRSCQGTTGASPPAVRILA